MLRRLLAPTIAALVFISASSASAALVLVGSWRLTDGPGSFSPSSAQQVAAQLFGANAADYVISISDQEINHLAWYAIGDSPGEVAIDDEGATSAFGQPISAFYFDTTLAQQANRFRNYAYREQDVSAAPEPASWALLIGGFGVAGATLRSRRHLFSA